MNKKGFIFTFISVTLVSVILMAFLIQYTSRTKVEIEKTNTEIETLNSFVKSLNEDYFPRALMVSGNQAILALLYCMDPGVDCGADIESELNNGYISGDIGELRNYIRNAIVDGEFETGLGGGADGPDLGLMTIDGVSYKLSNVINEIENLAEYTGIKLDITNEINENPFRSRMSVSQTDPWHIKITMELDYSVTNDDESVSWSYTDKVIESFIPISNLREPIYMIEERLNKIIKETIYSIENHGLVDNIVNNIEDHVLETYFVACSGSPSFLDRMIRNLGGNENGIESLVNVQNPSQSAIDFQYIFREEIQIPPENLVEIDGSGYYIDDTHSSCYGL